MISTLLYRHIKNHLFKIICFIPLFIVLSIIVMIIGNIVVTASKGLFVTYITLPSIRSETSCIENYDKSIKNLASKLNLDSVVLKSALASNAATEFCLEEISNNNQIINLGISDYLYSQDNIETYNLLKTSGNLITKFNWKLFYNSDSTYANKAGVLGGLIGSFFVIIVCISFSLPLGVMTALYLYELAPKRSAIIAIIEIIIQNLAAVPSIIFGILSVSVFLVFMNMPRSSTLVGGLTLAIMSFPVIVISTKQALISIPNYIREGCIALGATPTQTSIHHILPLALPGIITGFILSISRALGETAPLILIGMSAFIINVPHNIWDPSTVMPVLIYQWSTNPDPVFVEKTSAAILILLFFLLFMQMSAIYIRKKYTYKW